MSTQLRSAGRGDAVASPRAGRRSAIEVRHARERRLGLLLVAPAVILLLLVLLLPTLFAFAYSLLDITYAKVVGFAGLANWEHAVFVRSTWALLGRTAVFVAGTVILTIGLAFPIAMWLDKLTRRRALAMQIVVILPWVLSTVVAALLFRWTWLENLGIGLWIQESLTGSSSSPLLTRIGAMTSLILIYTWRTLGFAVLLILAGLKGLDRELYEAATVDGANAPQRFRYLTVPLLKTTMTIVVIVLIVSSFNNAEVPMVVTGGGPGESTLTIALKIYRTAFTDLNFGSAAALASAAMVLNVLLVVAYTRLSGLKVDE
jgi:ABC-type sugar transport system permease subunit